MLIINIFHASSLLLVVIMFFMWQLSNLCETKREKVKMYLVAGWIVTAVVMASSFITIEIWG